MLYLEHCILLSKFQIKQDTGRRVETCLFKMRKIVLKRKKTVSEPALPAHGEKCFLSVATQTSDFYQFIQI